MQHGHAWNGLFIRKNFKHFHEIRRRLDELIMKGLPARRTGGPSQTNYLYFQNGAQVMLTAIESPEKLDFFLGSAFTEISVEEATTFPFIDQLVNQLRGCLRSAHGVKCTMFLTSNPGGPGHSFIKSKFISPARQGGVPIKEREDGDTKIFIPSNVEDNRILVENDPQYKQKLESIEDPELRRAWLFGDWDVVLGGFFDDIWNQQKSKIVIPYFKPPKHWDRIVGFDWGSARPFSVGWYAVSGGEFVPELGRALPRGALVRFFEWYGCVKERPNTGLRMESRDVARQILELEAKHDLVGHAPPDRIADPAVFKQEDGPSIGEKMAEQGVVWRKGDNKRIPGWDIMRSLMRGEMSDWEVMTDEDGKEMIINAVYEPMLYVTENCKAWLRTVPVLERDEKEPEDIDCFVEETLISVPEGERPIEEIQIGDYVNTPIGPRRVTNNFCQGPTDTHIVELANGKALEGTKYHKIFHPGYGLQPLCMIPSDTENENLLIEEGICQLLKSSLIEESISNEGTGTSDTSSVIQQLANGMDLVQRFSTDLCGRIITEIFQQDTASITKTTTPQTTSLKTLNSFLRAIMLDTISKKELETVTLPQTVQDMLSGGTLKREGFSFEKMLERCVSILPKENLRALIVATLLERLIKQGNIVPSASKKTRAKTSILSGRNAQSAESNIKLAAMESAQQRLVDRNAAGSLDDSDTDTAINSSARSAAKPFMLKDGEKLAATSVVRSYAGNEKKLVYNLEVEQSRLYYAEGVLASNTTQEDHCADECRYVAASRPGHGKSMLDIPEPKGPMELEHEQIQAIGREGEDLEMPRVIQDFPDNPLKDFFSAADEFDEW